MYADVRFGDRIYTYNYNNKDIKVGDYVRCPLGDKIKVGKVIDIGVPEPSFMTESIIEVSETPNEDDVEGVVDTLAVRKLADISKMEVDVETVWAKLASMLPDPKYIVVTPANYKDVKGSVQRTLKNAEKDLEEARKTPQRVFNEARASYDEGMRELVKRVHARWEAVKQQTEEFDAKVREEHRAIAEAAIKKFSDKFELEPIFRERLGVRDEYLNLSTTKKSIESSVQSDAEQLAMTQENYHTRLESIKVIVEEANKNITNKLNVDDYKELTLESSLNMEPHTVVVSKIQEDAKRRAEMERKAIEAAQKAKEIKLKEEAERAERERQKAEEAEYLAQHQKPRALDEKEEIVSETLFVKATRTQLTQIMNYAKNIGAEVEIGF